MLVGSIASAANQVVDATIAEVTERGFILTVGTEPLAVEDESTTRFWKGKAQAKRDSFKAGDQVKVRLKTDVDPTVLREIADRPTYAWLEKIRKEPMPATIKKADAKYVTVKFDDGSEFAYRATDKTKIDVGDAKAVGDLKEGMKVYAKGRTLPSLDTFLVTLSGKPIAVATKTKTPPKPKPKRTKLDKEGTLKGTITYHLPLYRMFDVEMKGSLLHITYTPQTAFTGGTARDIAVGAEASVQYRRDGFGRIIALKVELKKSSKQ
jgi:hypothetical protein